MPAKADLHIHTTASDGKMKPEEVVQAAADMHLAVIAITDHDTAASVLAAREAAAETELEVLVGVEITTAFEEQEVHLLAYAFNVHDERLLELLSSHQQARMQRASWIIKKLGKKGLSLDLQEVLAEANSRNVGRPHIAAVLKDKGYVANIREAFIRYLSNEKLGVIKNNYHSLKEVVEIVKQAGGVTVIAHPGRLFSEEELLLIVEAGIDGIEVLHPSHNYEIQKKMEAFAEQHHLITTGGSDFHGAVNTYYGHFGTLTIPVSWVEKIKQLAEHRKEISV